MSKYFYHGTSLYNMLDILQCGEIKSQRNLGYNFGIGNNGLDYISLCNKLDDSLYDNYLHNAFIKYIKDNYCFIISDEVSAIKAEYNSKLNKNYRYSDKIDEYQVKNSIGLDYIIGIGIPFSILSNISEERNSDKKNILNNIIELAKIYNLDIIDTSDNNFVEKYELNKGRNKVKYIV